MHPHSSGVVGMYLEVVQGSAISHQLGHQLLSDHRRVHQSLLLHGRPCYMQGWEPMDGIWPACDDESALCNVFAQDETPQAAAGRKRPAD